MQNESRVLVPLTEEVEMFKIRSQRTHSQKIRN